MPASNFSQTQSVVTLRYVDPQTVTDADQLALWHTWLDAQERARMQRFVQARHRQDFLVSHALTRAVLADALGCAPSDIVYGTTGRNKPVIAHPFVTEPIHFNLAHTDGLAMVAVSSAPLGVDVEHLHRQVAGAALARRYFTEREYDDIVSQDAAEQQRRFLMYWTLKEAYLKAQAWGIVDDLGGFEFELGRSAEEPAIRLRVRPAQVSPTEPWRFHHWQPTAHHLASLAVSARLGTQVKLDCQAWSDATSPRTH